MASATPLNRSGRGSAEVEKNDAPLVFKKISDRKNPDLQRKRVKCESQWSMVSAASALVSHRMEESFFLSAHFCSKTSGCLKLGCGPARKDGTHPASLTIVDFQLGSPKPSRFVGNLVFEN
ncbi:MAG: hypothetical protein ACKOLA_05110 [Spartobacteria bacterium]